MARKVQFHPLARTDLYDLFSYIEEQAGPERAGGYIERLERLCASLADYPERTLPRDDLMPGLRTVAMERRVLIALTVTAEDVTILRVLYAGRELLVEELPH